MRCSQASVAWHDSTPIGRIVSRLSKDIITLDDQLPMQWNQLLTQGMNVLGVVALIFYSFPWLGLMLVPLFFLYYCVAAFYRATSREVKRLDSIVRLLPCGTLSACSPDMSLAAPRCADAFLHLRKLRRDAQRPPVGSRLPCRSPLHLPGALLEMGGRLSTAADGSPPPPDGQGGRR
jgi:hypothetical protein